MLDSIKSTLSNPEFQRKSAQAAGKVVSIVASLVISSLVEKAVSTGIDKVMDRIQKTEVIPAE